MTNYITYCTEESKFANIIETSIHKNYAKREYRCFELCVFKNTFVIQKTEKHKKKPVHSLLFLTRFSRDDLLLTESGNIHSLQSLL